MKNNSNRMKLIAWVSFLAVCLAIFLFSAQPAPESSAVSEGVLNVVLRKVIRGLSKLPEPERKVRMMHYQHVIRKMAHFFIYALWGFAFGIALRLHGINGKKHVLFVAAGGLLYAALDELHQYFVPGRSGQFTDVLLDFAGVMTGWLVLMVVFRFWRCIKK